MSTQRQDRIFFAVFDFLRGREKCIIGEEGKRTFRLSHVRPAYDFGLGFSPLVASAADDGDCVLRFPLSAAPYIIIIIAGDIAPRD